MRVIKSLLMLIQLPPPVHGVSVANELLANSQLLRQKFDVRVVDYRFSGSLEEMQKKSMIKYLRFLKLFIKVFFILIFKRPSLVYFTISPLGSSFIRDSLMVLLFKVFCVKVYLHLHGKGIGSINNSVLINYYRYIFSRCRIISISNILATDIATVYDVSKVRVCMNGVQSCFFSDKDGLDDFPVVNNFNVVYFSNLLPMKGIDIFLEVARKVSLVNADVSFHIVGPPNMKFDQSDIDDYFISFPEVKNRVNFHGGLYGDDKKRLLSKMDILIHPTRNDALPLVILEAMSCGACVLASDQGGIPDVITDGFNGFVMSNNDVNIYIEKLLWLLSNPNEINRISLNAKMTYETGLTENHFIERVVNALTDA